MIGAGVLGASTALALAEKGFSVSVAERASALGQGASGANGAQLSYYYTDALASPETRRMLPKLLLGLNSAFRLSPRADLDFVRWGIQFLRNTTASRSDANTLAILELALRSKEVLMAWREQYQFEFNHRLAPKLHLYEDQRLLDDMQRRLELKNQQGANQHMVSRQQAIDIEPTLEHMRANLVGAIHSPDEEVGDVEAFTQLALQKALELGGGRLFLNTEISDIRTRHGRAQTAQTTRGELEFDHLVICAGYRSTKLARQLGIKVGLIYPVAGYSLTYPQSSGTPEVSLTDTANRFVLCRLGDQLRMAGMADVGRVVTTAPAARVKQLRNLLQHRFPQAGDYRGPERAWVGVRPLTPSSQPLVEKTAMDNVYINAGHGFLGWTLAAGSAEQISKLIIEQA